MLPAPFSRSKRAISYRRDVAEPYFCLGPALMPNRWFVIAILLACRWLSGIPPVAAAEANAAPAAQSAAAPVEKPEAHAVITASHQDPVAESKLSEAERISRLQRTHDSDQKHRSELQAELDNLDKEYQQADSEFKQLDSQLEAARRDLGKTPSDLTAKWDLAKQRFELAIREKKALQASISSLETKMARDQELIDKLEKPTAADPAADGPEQPGEATGDETPASGQPTAADAGTSASAAGLVVSGMVGSLVPLPGSVPTLTSESNLGSMPPVLPSEARSKELSAAAKESKKRNVVAHEAQVALQSATERQTLLERNIALERTLLETAQQKVANIEATVASLETKFNQQLLSGVEPGALAGMHAELADAKTRLRAGAGRSRPARPAVGRIAVAARCRAQRADCRLQGGRKAPDRSPGRQAALGGAAESAGLAQRLALDA